MSYKLDHFKRNMDPYLSGLSNHAQIALGYALTGGLVFPFAGGCIVLARRRLYPTVGPWSYCGWARLNSSTIEQYRGFDHGVNTAWQYASARALGNGFVSDLSEPVRVDFDGAAARINPPLPNFPTQVSVETIAAGKFTVRWEYDPYGQGAFPTDFQVFKGTSSSVDYNTPIVDQASGANVIPARIGVRGYALTTPAYSDGTQHWFGVRARSSAAVAEKNTFVVGPFTAKASGPATATATGVVMRHRV